MKKLLIYIFSISFLFILCTSKQSVEETETKLSYGFNALNLNDFVENEDWLSCNTIMYNKETLSFKGIGKSGRILYCNAGSTPLLSVDSSNSFTVEFEFILPSDSKAQILLSGSHKIQLSNVSWENGYLDSLERHESTFTKAPGLWQKITLQLNSNGVKGSNSVLDFMEINGHRIHETDTLGMIKTGPFISFIAEKGIAIRNLNYRFYEENNITISTLDYNYYRNITDQIIPDFDTIPTTDSGQIDSFLVGQITDTSNAFAIKFEGKITLDFSGDVRFLLFSDDGGKLYIDDSLIVDNDGVHPPIQKSGDLQLDIGKHDIRVDYLQSGGGYELALSYETLNSFQKGIASLSRIQSSNSSPPFMEIIPSEKPEIIRSFFNNFDKKVTHAISIGSPESIHYTLNLETGSLIHSWQGRFGNVADMFIGRGAAQTLKPIGFGIPIIDKICIAELSNQKSNWPDSISKNFQFLYYEIEELGNPFFVYQYGKSEWKYSYGIDSSERSVKADVEIINAIGNLYGFVATAKQILTVSDNFYSIDNQYFVQTSGAGKFILKKDNALDILIYQVPPSSIHSFSYKLIW